MSEDIAEIAAKLTKVQRDWLRDHKLSEKWLAAHGLTDGPLMERTGTISRWGGDVHKHHRLTDLGLAVRAHLLARENGGAK
jgi:hypothetical protein